jgi:hypothetical protein
MTTSVLGSRLSHAAVGALLLVPAAAPAQTLVPEVTWTLTTDQPIEWLHFCPSHLLVLSSDDGLQAVDLADGSVHWRRDDLGNVSPEAFAAGLQNTPIAAGPQPPVHIGPLVRRLMEQLPGGRLGAILTDSTGARTWFDVIDLESGKTVWSSTALAIGEARGFLEFPDSTTILVYGSTTEHGRTRGVWARVEAATGKTLWVTDSLLLASPMQFDGSGSAVLRGTINGNQPLVPLADSTLLLYASADGLVRFEGGSGRIRWRSPVSSDHLGPTGQGYAPLILADDIAYLPAGRSVNAIEITSGRRLWASESFATMTTHAEMTPGGLLIEGTPYAVAGENPQARRPFAALIDPHTGKARWKKQFDWGSGITPFLLNGDSALIASDRGLIRLSLSGANDTTFVAETLPGRPAFSLEARDGGVLIGAAHSLTLLAPDGTHRYQMAFPPPILGAGDQLIRLAIGVASIAFTGCYCAGYLIGSATDRYQQVNSRFTTDYAYFVLRDFQGRGPTLGKIDKATGAIVAAVPLAHDKTPEYAVDPYTGVVVIKKERVLLGYRW